MNNKILNEIYDEFRNNLLQKWYPLVIDKKCGGYFSNISYDWKVENVQDKMVVTQARHIWTLSKASELTGNENFKKYALHGYEFIKDKMWDDEFGGFFQIRDRTGNITETEKWYDEKRIYGNAFAIYGLAALYKVTKDKDILDLAIKTFDWIEDKGYDPINKGYLQFLTREGKPFGKNSEYQTEATDKNEAGYKDHNSSIHLLEAFTELYNVFPDTLVKERLTELLFLIRDRIVTEKGYLNLFFEEDWTPISFKKSSKGLREKNYGLDHVSFGHDYETAFLMLEASYTLGIKNDWKTLSISKKMLDHAVQNGWDSMNYGFFDEGYYFEGEKNCTIIKDTKTWWQQAEGLNALLLFSKIFPENYHYFEKFDELWKYVQKYSIDKTNKGWFWGSIEKEPFMKNEPKGSIWKAAYHDGRSLMNCFTMLADEDNISLEGLIEKKKELNKFLSYWRKVKSLIVEI